MIAAALPAAAGEPAHAAIFTRAFSPDFVATADDALPGEKPRPAKIYFRVTDLGAVSLPSGKIVVADAFVGIDQKPLALTVAAGAYPVRLAVLQGTMGRGRVAFARVNFTDAPVVRWAAANPDDMSRDAENPAGVWGFAVDSGLAAFFAPEAGAAASEAVKINEDFFDTWLEKGQNAGVREPGTTGAFRLVADIGPANVVAFDAGWGDGVYSAYAGYAADGALAALVADFDILDWSKVTE